MKRRLLAASKFAGHRLRGFRKDVLSTSHRAASLLEHGIDCTRGAHVTQTAGTNADDTVPSTSAGTALLCLLRQPIPNSWPHAVSLCIERFRCDFLQMVQSAVPWRRPASAHSTRERGRHRLRQKITATSRLLGEQKWCRTPATFGAV